MLAPTPHSLPTQADLAQCSLEEALALVSYHGEVSLVVEQSDACEAGRLTERMGLGDPMVIPDGIFSWGTWMLRDKYEQIVFLNTGY